jgi:ABC-type transport system involved in multi-copper enzyme maturation permease subunit
MSGIGVPGLRRVYAILAADVAYHARRPLFVVWVAVVILCAWGFSAGTVRISSGDATVGGTKSHITSEFAVAMQFAIVTTLFYGLFVAVAAGMAIIQDEEWRVGELIHSTPLRTGEYVWAKFTGVLAGCLLILVLHVAAMMLFYHVLPNAKAQEIRGAFHLLNYLKPAIIFALPTIVFFAGISFWVGEWSRRPVAVYLLPVAIVMLDSFVLWEWSPSWLDPRINTVLGLVDPAGFRWLNETWLKVDRGVQFYNTSAIPPDGAFLLSRAVMLLLGLGAVALTQRHLAASLRGAPLTRRRDVEHAVILSPEPERGQNAATIQQRDEEPRPLSLAGLGMTTSRPGLLAGAWHVAGVECAELRSSAGLYLFVPLLLLETLGATLIEVGFLDSPLLITPSTFAVRSMGTLVTCLSLLLLFYAVESLERERSTRLAAIAFATPIRTGSILLGKFAALAVLTLVIVLAVASGGILAILIQNKVTLDVRPLVLYWGLLLAPTILVWIAFVMAIHTVTQSRYTTYALSLALIYFTGYRLLTDQINWVGNWPLWDAVRASDISVLELDRAALALSRAFAVGLAVFFTALTIRCARRREVDATRLVHRLRVPSLARAGLALAPWAIVPAVAGIWLALDVERGREGGAAKKQEKDYWRKNLATYRDAPVPDLRHVDLHLDLFPERGGYHARGTYKLVNEADRPLREILLTGGFHWQKLVWTMDGNACSPDNRAHLYVFTPPGGALGPGQAMQIGFEHEGTFPDGISKRTAGAQEFILPSAAVLTSLRASIAPVLGFQDSIGVDEENRQDSKEFRDDFYEGQTDSFLGARTPFSTRITITGPAVFELNSVGTKTKETMKDGRRTVVWESDHPVSFWNVVAGKWAVERGEGTAVFYDASHRYNLAEIREALDAARRYCSDWFYPFPWGELKLSEFPALATYAQGFPTNITFSEGVGFLTRSTPEIHAAFEITAHEAAHQWWGNILTPGKGPGGNILSEGTAHFSVILLVEQTKGLNARIDFCKRIEAQYGKDRQVDSERPLVKIDNVRPGDTTVTYDKGGWVFWMLLNHMGRERALAGMRAFIKTYEGNPDHPVLQDFRAAMRPFAPDAGAYDEFTHQWFHEVVVPEYRLESARKNAKGTGWEATARLENAGSGTMPVEVAATRGQRFAKDGSESPDYLQARTTVTLGKGQTCEIVIPCSFEPEQIIVDPDAKVLQLQRKNAAASL